MAICIYNLNFNLIPSIGSFNLNQISCHFPISSYFYDCVLCNNSGFFPINFHTNGNIIWCYVFISFLKFYQTHRSKVYHKTISCTFDRKNM